MSGVFEHLMTLGSFILALGLTTILLFLAALVHRRSEVKLSTAHLLWMSAIFVNQINFWLGSYVFHDIAHSSYPTIAFVIVFPILLYLQSALVVADADKGASLDMVAHHARNKGAYIGLVVIATGLDAIYFTGIALLNPGFDPTVFLAADVVFIASGLFAIQNQNRLVQIAVPAVHLGLRVFGFFLSAMPLLAG